MEERQGLRCYTIWDLRTKEVIIAGVPAPRMYWALAVLFDGVHSEAVSEAIYEVCEGVRWDSYDEVYARSCRLLGIVVTPTEKSDHDQCDSHGYIVELRIRKDPWDGGLRA